MITALAEYCLIFPHTGRSVFRGINQQFKWENSLSIAISWLACVSSSAGILHYRALATSHSWRAGVLGFPARCGVPEPSLPH